MNTHRGPHHRVGLRDLGYFVAAPECLYLGRDDNRWNGPVGRQTLSLEMDDISQWWL